MERISKKQIDTSERFIMIPKALLEDQTYSKMRAETKLAYGILKERFKLSLKNNWIDDDGNVFLYYSNASLAEILGVGKDKVIRIKKELKEYDLLEEERQGLNKPNRLYIGNIEVNETVIHRAEPLNDAEVANYDFRKSDYATSRSLKIRHQEVVKSDTSNTEYRDTELSDTDSTISLDDEDEIKLNTEPKIAAEQTTDQYEIRCGELIGSNFQIRDLVLKNFSDMLIDDPKTMVNVIEELIYEFSILGIKLDQGNSVLKNLANKLGRDGAILFVLNQTVEQQLEHMRENLVDYTHFATYFAKGLSNRVILATTVQPRIVGY